MEHALSNGEQSLLYLNRRGTARLVLCTNCGWQASCPHCDIPLTYHGDSHKMRCHSCNYGGSPPTTCPSCGNPNIEFKAAGTKAIFDEVQKLFSHARISRFDTDNTKGETFESQYALASSGQIDILIGTQIIAKGLDLPALSVVGVLLADTSLYIPDFTAQERTYQLINQVIGRVGRGHTDGKAIIQTYNPDHPIIKLATENDYKGFYDMEIPNREQYLFPPFCYLLKISLRRASPHSAQSGALRFKHELAASGLKIQVEGPAPAFHERLNNRYEWQLVVKSKQRSELLKVIDMLPANWSHDIDPVDLL